MDFTTILWMLIPLIIVYIWYASIIGKRNKAQESLSGIDVQLKKRSNLIPNLLKIAKKFMEHERGLMEKITKLRAKVDAPYDQKNSNEIKDHLALAEQLSGQMGKLMIAVEDYPDLKSDQTMLHAMQSYNEIEAQIAAARRFYNASVTALNNAVQIFPGNVIAKLASVTAFPFYEADESAKAPVDADQFLG